MVAKRAFSFHPDHVVLENWRGRSPIETGVGNGTQQFRNLALAAVGSAGQDQSRILKDLFVARSASTLPSIREFQEEWVA